VAEVIEQDVLIEDEQVSLFRTKIRPSFEHADVGG
jgi:hypothetical protein